MENSLNTASIGLLDPAKIEIYTNPNGFLAMKNGNEDFKRVRLTRVLPFSEPFCYIAVSDTEGKEIGIIADLSELSQAQAELVKKELDSRYYCPTVSSISEIKEKMGYFYFDVMIGSYKKIFAVRDISRNIKQLQNGAIIITDVDGNRFIIPDIHAIGSKSRRKIEPYLY